MLLLPTAVWAQPAAFHPQPAPRTTSVVYVAPTGSDAVACAQATNGSTPRRSINGGVQCLQPGGVLDIAPGVYNELLSGQFAANQTVCQSNIAQVQSPCGMIPSGLSASQPTTIRGVKGVVISPVGKSFPGGGGILTLGAASKYLRFEGLALTMDQAFGGGSGVAFGDAQHVTLTRSEVDGGTVNAAAGSRFLTITHTDIHHAGRGCDNQVQRTPPCPHGIYVRGQDIVIEDNIVRHNSDYGIQASSEEGGIARVSIQRNQVYGNPGVGIRAACTDCIVAANIVYKNGVGITYGGKQTLIAHNTIISYKEGSDDPWGIYGSKGSATVVNNLLYQQQSSWYAIGYTDFSPPDPAMIHHNMSEWPAGENAGMPLSAPMAQVFVDPASYDYTLKAGSPAIQAGVAVTGVPFDQAGHPWRTPPSLGAYAATAPEPPDPPVPPTPGGWALACTGQITAVPGGITMRCTPEAAR
jgi:hypothetical protein